MPLSLCLCVFVCVFRDLDSQYPDGHYVRTIGPVGTLDSEIEALLVTHSALPYPFSAAAEACLPEVVVEDDATNQETTTTATTGGTSSSRRLCNWTPPEEECARRRDLRDRRVFSVDPPGCQDIDDAMSVEMSPDGSKYLIGVHIADVTYFVRANSGILFIIVSSTLTLFLYCRFVLTYPFVFIVNLCVALDKEAAQRATTIYLNDRRFDMLPSLLSGDVCSLHGNTERFAVSTIFEVDANTFVVDQDPRHIWFGRTVIKSVAAMTYEQGHRMLQGQPPDPSPHHHRDAEAKAKPLPPPPPPHPAGQAGAPVPKALQKDLRKDLEILTHVARVQKARRVHAGSVSFVKWDDCNLLLNDTREPVALEMEAHLEIHDTIAELMILANAAVATRIFQDHPSAALLRRHTAPSQERFDGLRSLTRGMKDGGGGGGVSGGVSPPPLQTQTNKALETSLAIMRQRAHRDVVAATTAMAITAMSEAEYICSGEAGVQKEHMEHLLSHMRDDGTPPPSSSTMAALKPFEHYGLGLQYYTHFTSPIRRYADVMVHRLLLDEDEDDASAAAGDRGRVASKQAASASAGGGGGGGGGLPPSSTMSTVDTFQRATFVDDASEAARRNYEGMYVAAVRTAPGLLPMPSLDVVADVVGIRDLAISGFGERISFTHNTYITISFR